MAKPQLGHAKVLNALLGITSDNACESSNCSP